MGWEYWLLVVVMMALWAWVMAEIVSDRKQVRQLQAELRESAWRCDRLATSLVEVIRTGGCISDRLTAIEKQRDAEARAWAAFGDALLGAL